MSNRITLFDNQLTNVNGTAVENKLSRAELRLSVFGTFDSGTFTLETLAVDGTTWIAENDTTRSLVSITANENITLTLPYGIQVRGVVTGGGGSLDITAVIIRQARRA